MWYGVFTKVCSKEGHEKTRERNEGSVEDKNRIRAMVKMASAGWVSSCGGNQRSPKVGKIEEHSGLQKLEIEKTKPMNICNPL